MNRQLMIRTKEIIDAVTTSGEEVSTNDALRQALIEIIGRDPDKLLDFAVQSNVATIRIVEKGQYVLKEPHQDALFDTPSAIAVEHIWYPKAEQTVGVVGQYIQDGRRHHSVQLLRFNRAEVDHQKIADLYDDDTPWVDARRGMLTDDTHDPHADE